MGSITMHYTDNGSITKCIRKSGMSIETHVPLERMRDIKGKFVSEVFMYINAKPGEQLDHCVQEALYLAKKYKAPVVIAFTWTVWVLPEWDKSNIVSKLLEQNRLNDVLLS